MRWDVERDFPSPPASCHRDWELAFAAVRECRREGRGLVFGTGDAAYLVEARVFSSVLGSLSGMLL